MKSLGSIFGILMLIMIVMYSMQQVGNQSISNSNLDNASTYLILNISGNLDQDFNIESSFDEQRSNLTENATYDNVDTFAQEYLEGKSDSAGKTGVVKSLVKVPDLVILSLGVPQEDVSWIKAIMILILTVAVSFATYRAFFGGGKVTNN